jgi:hypothetical protein
MVTKWWPGMSLALVRHGAWQRGSIAPRRQIVEPSCAPAHDACRHFSAQKSFAKWRLNPVTPMLMAPDSRVVEHGISVPANTNLNDSKIGSAERCVLTA